MKTPACTLGPKHKWTFVRNIARATLTTGAGAVRGRVWTVGFYKCACGATRHWQTHSNEPGASVTDHLDINKLGAK